MSSRRVKAKTPEKNIERLNKWRDERRKDPVWRAQQNARQKARMDQLRADAELGRLARVFLDGLAQILSDFADLKGAAAKK